MALADVIKKIFGSKADRDMKAVKPILDKVLAAYPEIDKLSNDGLRAKSEELKKRIREVEAPFETRIAEIKEELAKDIPVSEKEALATESDKLVKDEDEAIEKILNEILPEAFSIMKSTARRFAQNETITVSATDFDRYLAASGKDFVHIDGDNAVWQNHWVAGGNEITWDMVHYDVQLIGGIVLHQGKIAEMATGEGKTLVATLPVFLNALAGKGVHVVTVNDYLSKRDSELMGMNPIAKPVKRLITAILPLVPTTSSASTTSVTIWLSVWMTSSKGSIITQSSMRSTPSLSMTPVPLSLFPVLPSRQRMMPSSWSSSLMWRTSTISRERS